MFYIKVRIKLEKFTKKIFDSKHLKSKIVK